MNALAVDLAKLENLLETPLRAVGYELWGLEYVPAGQYSVLRVYIDSEKGITIDDCETASRQINASLEVEEIALGNYRLEVSSPGMDRILFKKEQVARYIGEQLKVSLYQTMSGQRNFTGTLEAIEDDKLSINIDGETRQFVWADIKRARLVNE